MSGVTQNQLTRWQRNRRAFLEHRIFWHGSLGLADLMSVMEISRAQASKDINAYIADHPDHLYYDKSARTYVMGSAFTPHYLAVDAADHLESLVEISKGVPIANADWIVDRPDAPRTKTEPSSTCFPADKRIRGPMPCHREHWRVLMCLSHFWRRFGVQLVPDSA